MDIPEWPPLTKFPWPADGPGPVSESHSNSSVGASSGPPPVNKSKLIEPEQDIHVLSLIYLLWTKSKYVL